MPRPFEHPPVKGKKMFFRSRKSRSPWTNYYAPLFPTPTIGMKWAFFFFFGVHGCEPGRVSDGSRPALCQTLSIECRSFIVYLSLTCVFCYYFVIHVPFSLSFVCLCFSLLSLELGRCSSDLFLSSRPRTGLATTCIIGYG